MAHESFATVERGLNRDSVPMRLFEKAKRLGIWNPSDFDFTQDAEDWKALADFSDYVLFGKDLPDPQALYQEPWSNEPLHFSWTAPR